MVVFLSPSLFTYHYLSRINLTRRVVITGLGLVTPVSNTVEATWSALMSGRSGAKRQKFDVNGFP
jgi:3-oxoacyl-(acyl-carrier-protein) synthase